MPIDTRYLFAAAMDVDPAREALFHEVYDREHVPALLRVPGVRGAARFVAREGRLVVGGELRPLAVGDQPKYLALYELDHPDVLVSPAWAAAVEAGRWPAEVRPFTRNRRHALWERLGP